jgi:excisionase family DNA binding protein
LDKKYYNVEQAAEYLGLSRHTLNLWRRNKTGPSYSKLGSRIVYNVADLDSWVSGELVEAEKD